MQNLRENQQLIYYAQYVSSAETTDDGKLTGERTKTYTTPKPYWIYVSPSKGETLSGPFGRNADYTNIMSTSDLDCPIDENTVLWIRKDPNSGAHNYRVTLKAIGLNSIRYAITKVDVT